MLRIVVQGFTLQLPDDISLNLVIENPLTLTDRIPTPYTTSFDLPPTPDNLRFFNFPNRVTSIRGFKEYEDCNIFFGPINIISGVIVVQQFDKKIKAYFRGVVFSDSLKKSLCEQDIQRYDFGTGSLFSPDFVDPDNFAYKYRQLIFSTILSRNAFIAAPVRIKDAPWPFQKTDDSYPSDYGFYAAQELYFNFFNARRNDYMLTNGTEISSNSTHSTIFPFPFVKSIFEAIFGDLLEKNAFSEGELANVVLFSSYNKQFSSSNFSLFGGILLDNTYFENDNYFTLNSFLPSSAANDFFRDIFKIFCCTLFCVKGRFRIVYNEDIITNKSVSSWTSKLIGDLSVSKQAGQFYSYGYSNYKDSADSAVEIDNMADLITANPADDEVSYKIKSINQVISKKKITKENTSDPDRWKYEVKSYGFGGSDNNSSLETFDMTSSVAPLPVNVEEYWYQNFAPNGEKIELNNWAVPVWEGDRLTRPETATILIYQSLSNTFRPGDRYPLVTPYNIDHFGNKLGGLSLNWTGEDGLLNRYHRAFKSWIERDRIKASGSFLLSSLDLKNLDLTKKIHVKGKLFFIEKLSITIRTRSIDPAVIDLIEAPFDLNKTYVTVKRQDFTRNNCEVGQTGTPVPFTRVYTSEISQEDADSQADNDITFDADGQNWANAHGFCEIPENVIAGVECYISAGPYSGGKYSTIAYAGVTLSGRLSVDLTLRCQVNINRGGREFISDAIVSVVVKAGALAGHNTQDVGMDYSPDFSASGIILSALPNPAGGINVKY